MKKMYTVFWIVFAISQCKVQAQTHLIGTVKDNHGSTIPFADVTLYQNGVLCTGKQTDFDGQFHFWNINAGLYDLECRFLGYETARFQDIALKIGDTISLEIVLSEGAMICDEVVVLAYKLPKKSIRDLAAKAAGIRKKRNNGDISIRGSRNSATHYYIDGKRVNVPNNPARNAQQDPAYPVFDPSTEEYDHIEENGWSQISTEPLSTFSIDVDRAAYSNIRRFIEEDQLPPGDAVRIEEMINYFNYNYERPTDQEDPFTVATTVAECPWNTNHQILHVALQAKDLPKEELDRSMLTFLIDVSGSMQAENKLPLVKKSLLFLLHQLHPDDKIAIVTYAGQAGVALPPTKVNAMGKIKRVINGLGAGGSTAGAQGILTAYELAETNFNSEKNNRVILLTDGDFNVGTRDNNALEKLIEKKRKTGIYLSVLGFGMGNYKDNRMQILADKGNGNHGYIDDIDEAKKLFGKEFAGTLHTLAKDVKLQIEFNPSNVQAYRLIGYENRMLDDQDFNDDTKDAGEIGVGHSVTAMYEIIPTAIDGDEIASIDPLRYQESISKGKMSHELGMVKIRYKAPQSDVSTKFQHIISSAATETDELDTNVLMALTLAEWGMMMRRSDYVKSPSIDRLKQNMAKIILLKPDAERRELKRLISKYESLRSQTSS